MLHTYLYNNVKLVSFKEGEIVINSETIADPHFSRTIAKFISKWTGRIRQVSTSSSNIGKTLYEEDLLTQQKEIEIMKIVGASSLYIRFPFILEAIMESLIGAVVAVGLGVGLMTVSYTHLTLPTILLV